ncbi:MAG: hypothetical protein LBF54_04720 [Holosporaceae bacterium]|nr:hypothetical protein [Holosporaceae bacterium]
MESITFSCGSKTFLVGEYAVLFRGSAIVLITPPEFKLIAESGKSDLIGVEKNSPAYLFYESHDFGNLSISFHDPHSESGGFGASSAQFTLLYKLYLKLNRQEFDINAFLGEYEKTSPGSGADCVAQYFNHSVFFDSRINKVEKIDWPFQNLSFAIFKTTNKVATHLHLRELPFVNTEDLQKLVLGVRKSFSGSDEKYFLENVHAFSNLLRKKNLVAEQTVEIVNNLLKIEGVKAAKGCGALSADTIIVILEKQKEDVLINYAEQSWSLKLIHK